MEVSRDPSHKQPDRKSLGKGAHPAQRDEDTGQQRDDREDAERQGHRCPETEGRPWVEGQVEPQQGTDHLDRPSRREGAQHGPLGGLIRAQPQQGDTNGEQGREPAVQRRSSRCLQATHIVARGKT